MVGLEEWRCRVGGFVTRGARTGGTASLLPSTPDLLLRPLLPPPSPPLLQPYPNPPLLATIQQAGRTAKAAGRSICLMTVLFIQAMLAATKRLMTRKENVWNQLAILHLLVSMTCLVLGMNDMTSETGSIFPSRSPLRGTRIVLQITLVAAVKQQVGSASMTCRRLSPQQGLMRATLQLAACVALLLVLAGVETNPGPTVEERRMPPMFAAIEAGDLRAVRRLLARDPSLVNFSWEGYSPLHLAVEEDNAGIVEEILGRGADIEAKESLGNTALKMAASKGQVSMASLLLQHGARVDATNHQGFSPLLSAANAGHSAIVNLLMYQGGRVDERLPDTQDTPLMLASLYGHLSTVSALLFLGAGLDLQRHGGFTALHLAAQEGHQACVEALLQGGADYSIPCRDGARPIHKAAHWNKTDVVRTLIDHGCSVDMAGLGGRTPLMDAALAAADATVAALLAWGATADATDEDERTALIFAIQSKCVSTISILAPQTTVKLGKAVEWLARAKVEVTQEVEALVGRAALDVEEAKEGLEGAARWGASKIGTLLLQNMNSRTLSESFKQEVLVEAVKSDDAATVSSLQTHLAARPSEATVRTARDRGVAGIVALLDPQYRQRGDQEKEELREAVINKTAGIMNRIPKSVEFTYNSNMKKVRPLLGSSTVAYARLVEELHVPKVHAGRVEERGEEVWEECPGDCSQVEDCSRMREALGLVTLLVEELGRRNEAFSGTQLSIVGSVKERSRAFYTDEADICLSLNKKLKHFTEFDDKHQLLKRDLSKSQTFPGINKYFNQDNTFNSWQFYHDFLETLHSIVMTMKIPTSFSMLPLTTSYSPCTRCMSTDNTGTPQARRCRHRPDCEEHRRCRCQDTTSCEEECQHKCRCQEFTSPSLSWSKIGAVLHLQWRRAGQVWTMDCDVVPTIPCGTRYDGSIVATATYLQTVRPVGWVEEYSKLEVMTDAATSVHLINSDSWQIRFRLVNRDTVLPRQGLLFMRDETLQGKKLEAYVIIKILKYLTNSEAKSFQIKKAVNQVFLNRSIESMEEVGCAIKEIIQHNNIRGKFTGVHRDLAKEGIVGVEVGEEGLHFLRHGAGNAMAESDEDEMVSQAIALSLEQERGDIRRDQAAGGIQALARNKYVIPEDEEMEMLSQAIAMSLEQHDRDGKRGHGAGEVEEAVTDPVEQGAGAGVVCGCGDPSRVREGNWKNGLNRGRRFHMCYNRPKGCRFFRWAEDL